MSSDYTFRDNVFVHSLLAGIEGANHVPELARVCLVGGGAVQYYCSKVPNTDNLMRPTIDVDIQADGYVPGSIRKRWIHECARTFNERGLKIKGSKFNAQSGAEIIVDMGKSKSFFTHLDQYNHAYAERIRPVIEASLERKRPISVEGKKPEETYFVEGPEDVIYFKLRPLIRKTREDGYFSAKEKVIVEQLALGNVDDVKVEDLEGRLRALNRLRGANLEELMREGPGIKDLVTKFKTAKNLYDVLLLVHLHRQMILLKDPKVIKDNLSRCPVL